MKLIRIGTPGLVLTKFNFTIMNCIPNEELLQVKILQETIATLTVVGVVVKEMTFNFNVLTKTFAFNPAVNGRVKRSVAS